MISLYHTEREIMKQMIIRVPNEMHHVLKRLSYERNISINAILIAVIAEYLRRENQYK
jgi:predicted HicB family RNase H-like nuclease